MAGSAPAMSHYFTIAKCPDEQHCSPQAWKNAKIWGWTEDECKAKLFTHLTTSSKHYGLLDASDASILAEEAVTEEKP